MSAEQLAITIVDSYIQQDERIVDDNARADFLRQGSQMGGFFGAPQISASQLANQLSRNITLTAVDLKTFPDLMHHSIRFCLNYRMKINPRLPVLKIMRNHSPVFLAIRYRHLSLILGHFIQLVSRNASRKWCYGLRSET